MKSNYGYVFHLTELDKEKLEGLISFSKKNEVDFWFSLFNWQLIKKRLKQLGYKKNYEQKYEQEIEIIYKKREKSLFFYI